MSSPSTGTENFTNGPLTVLHDENGRVVAVHRDRLVVAGDHEHAFVRLAEHRALLAQMVEERVRVDRERPAPEEVDVVEVGHGDAPRIDARAVSKPPESTQPVDACASMLA